MTQRKWYIDGRNANQVSIEATLAEARADKLKRSVFIRQTRAEQLEREIHGKKVGAAVRRAVREMEREARRRIHLVSTPLPVRYPGERTSGRFDDNLGIRRPRFKKPARDGLSTFHCKFTSRGLGDRRLDKGRPFRPGETVKHLCYILRPEARELSQGGLSSNISLDPNELAGVFAALEELEHSDRANSNVYMSLVISFPHELSAEGREWLLDRVCGLLTVHELPTVGVLHAPDINGDPRNFHAHIMFSLRPIEVEGPGRYAFAAEKYSDLNDESFIKPFRHEVAKLMNKAMAGEGYERRFTALSNQERGLRPMMKGQGKNSPGRTAWLRNMEDLKAIKTERRIRDDQARVIGRLRRTIVAMLNETPLALAAELQARRERVRSGLEQIKQRVASESPELKRTVANLRELVREKAVVARAQPAASEQERWVPIVDPERQVAIANAIEALANVPNPPLQRNGDKFALDPAKLHREELVVIDCFDAYPEVQKAFERHWYANLDMMRVELDHAGRCPVTAADSPDVLEGVLSPDLYEAYDSARDDSQVEEMLRAVRERWDERLKEKARRKAEAEAGIRTAANRYAGQMLANAAEASRDQLRGLLRLVRQMFLEGKVALRTGANGPELAFGTSQDRDWAKHVLAVPGGREFLCALGQASADMPKSFRPTAVLSLPPTGRPPARTSGIGINRSRAKDEGRDV